MQRSLQGVLNKYSWLITCPVSPPCGLFIFMSTIKICQKSLTHELVVKAVIHYSRQILTEHDKYVTTINLLDTISYLCAIIRTIHIPTPLRLLHLVNWQTFCLICQLDSLDFWHICLQKLSGIWIRSWSYTCDLKRRLFFSQRRTWSPIFGHMNTTFLQVTEDVHFC